MLPGDRLPEEDVETEDAERARESEWLSLESEGEPEVESETPRATPPDLNLLYPMPVKEETPEHVELGFTHPQYEEFKLNMLLGRKEEKWATWRAQ
jgi:hypothetical protein